MTGEEWVAKMQGCEGPRQETGFQGSKAYQRHLKRYVRGASHRFAAVVPRELGSLCRDELRDLGFSNSDVELSEAGVEFSGNLSSCYAANLWLRSASRILCRLHVFRAGALEELFSEAASFRWELWLSQSVAIHFEAHSSHSRIRHGILIEDTLRKAVEKRFENLGMTPPPKEQEISEGDTGIPESRRLNQRILVHLHRNRCQISIDTTGAHLHERGYRLRHAGAPIRETLAAAILMKCAWRGDVPLVDGMTGSGTIPIEAALISRRMPPGMNRTFLFENWPAFQHETWKYLRRKAGAHVSSGGDVPILGIDQSSAALAVAQDNAERAGVGPQIRWVHCDFFAFHPQEHGLAPGLLVLNPPYGKRLGGKNRPLYEGIGSQLRRFFEGWQVAVLAPDQSLAQALKIRRARSWPITHGGLRVLVVMARIL